MSDERSSTLTVDEAASALNRAATTLGIVPLPWQREVALRMLLGERVHLLAGRKSGRSTLKRLLDVAEALLGVES